MYFRVSRSCAVLYDRMILMWDVSIEQGDVHELWTIAVPHAGLVTDLICTQALECSGNAGMVRS